ncbi:hypothetical protein M885DRAFT_440724 [Pelagophyceae sp. CCMP2097]|nr:hypothetical protein M885DRAFT_440724 [Pelagophyceae sp. CCMP2097]
MVGPVGNGRYYCRGKEFGYCDRRSGTCVCNTGYQGVDCGACTPTHYASGSLCYPKRTCPNECSGQGECDYATGACACLAHRRGEDCATPRCTLFDSLCEECTDATCVRCVEGHFYSNATGCASCTVHDPRCASCNEFQCLECVDPLLWSIRRSGKRRSDSELPADELRRELSTYLEFGTQREDAFDEAEPFRVATASKPLKDLATRCDEGFDGTATFNCSALVVPAPNGTNGTVPKLSHVVCGHEGTLAWSSPTYEVAEDSTNVRLTVLRTGGGVGAVAVSYSLEHLTTDGSDVSATAFYATSLRLEFAPGVVELSFLVTIHDDRLLEADEECAFRLHSPAGGAVLGPQRTTVLTIRDDDAFRTAARYSRWRGDWHGVAGVPSGIYVVAHSAFGQISRIGGDRFVVEVEPYALLDRPDFGDADYDAGTNSPFYVSAKARRIVAAVLDVGDGTYTGTWAAAAAGDYRARAWLAVPGGLRGAYYRDAFGEEISRRQPSAVAPRQVDDNLLLSRIDARVHFEWRTSSLATGLAAAQAGPDFAVVRWSGRLRPDKTERFTLFVSATGDGLGARLWLDGRLLIDCWDVRRQACGERSARAELVADALHLVVLELRVTRFAGGGLHKGPAPNVAGGRGKALSFEWASETVPRQVIPKENLYYMDELPTEFKASDGLETSQTTVGAFRDFGNGTYLVEYTPTIAGEQTLYVTLGGAHVEGSPYQLRVLSNAAVAPSSTAEGPGLAHAKVNDSTWIVATARDGWGNPVFADVAGLSCEVVGPRNTTTVGTMTANYVNGTIMCSYQPIESGDSLCAVRFNGEHVHDSPFKVKVADGDVDGSTTFASGLGLTSAVAGVVSSFTIFAKDPGNNLIDDNARSNFTVLLTYGAEVVVGAVVHAGLGRYNATYNATVSGTYSLQVKDAVSGAHIVGSPFSPFLAPATCVGRTSTAIGRGLEPNVVACRASRVVVTARDAFGNVLLHSNDRIHGVFRGGGALNGSLDGKTENFTVEATALVLGPWEGSFKPNSKVVTFELTWQHERGADARIKLFWTHTSANNVDLERLSDYVVVPAANFWRSALIGDFTFDYDVIPGPTAASTSTVVHSDTYASGEWHAPFAIIETRDACSNLRLRGGDAVALVLFGPGGAAELAAVTDNGNGTYRTDLLVPTTGGYAASALVGAKASAAAALAVGDRYSPLISRADADASFLGSQVQDSPFTVDVVAGIASEETSSLSGAPLIGGVVSERPAIVYVDLRDATYNAAVEEPLESITATLTLRRRSSRHSVPKSSRDATPNVTVAKVGPSRFALTFTLYTAGLWDLTAKLRGKACVTLFSRRFSPVVGYYEIVCHAGPYATARSGAWGAVPRVAKADVDAEPSRRFTVVARDALGNDLESGGSWFRVRLRGSQIPAGGSPAYALDNGDGSYGIAWTTRGLQRGAYAVFVDVARQLAGARGGGGGLVGHYFTNGGLFGDADLVRDDAGPLDYDWGTGEVSPGAADHASVRWTGLLAAPLTGLFTLEVAVADADDAARIFLDGALVCETAPGQLAAQGSVRMVRGGMYALTVEYHEVRGSAGVALRWASDEVLMQPVPAFYLFPDSAAIDGSPFPLQLAEAGNATNVVYAADYADPAQPRTMYTHDGSVRLGEPVAPVNLPTLEPTS